MIKTQFIPLSATGRRPAIPMIPEYITVHSTANTATAQNEADNVCNNNPTMKVSFHIVVDDKQAIQVLPFNEVAWHAGDGFSTGNLKSIGIEICEPPHMAYWTEFDIVGYDAAAQQPYFDQIWQNAVELCVFLIGQFPTISVDEIVSHREGFARGTASGHMDPEHWWQFHNRTMDDFRAAVREALNQ